MAFVKEFISEADREKYRLDDYKKNVNSRSWVIDRARDCFFLYLGGDSNRPDMGIERPYKYWLFYYQDMPIIFDMFISGSDDHLPCLTYQIDHIHIYQGLSKIAVSLPSLLKEIKVGKDYFASLLKEAMDTFDLYCYDLSNNPSPNCYFFVFNGALMQ